MNPHAPIISRIEDMEHENENGYVIYPDSIGKHDIEDAIEYAAQKSKDWPMVEYRIEDCDTEKVIARFRNGIELA